MHNLLARSRFVNGIIKNKKDVTNKLLFKEIFENLNITGSLRLEKLKSYFKMQKHWPVKSDCF